MPVYDLEVEDAHEFFANGILVHNSTQDGGCYTCGVLMAATYDGRFYVEDVVRGRWSTFTRDNTILQTAQRDAARYNHTVRIFIEQEPGPIWEEEIVQMGDGSRRALKDVAVGDTVVNQYGVPTTVTAVHLQGDLPALRITTDSGRVVHAAPSHPFLTPTGWVIASDLTVGQALALRAGSRITPALDGPTLEECRLAGYFTGDGCCTFSQTSINAMVVCSDPVQGADITRCANSIGASVHVGGSRGWSYYLSGGGRSWLRRRGLAGKGTADKNVPEWVLTASDEHVAHFIGAFFACDGSVSVGKDGCTSIELYNTNRQLLEEIQSLLLRFGVSAPLRSRRYSPEFQKNRKTCYRIVLRKGDDSFGKFAERIPVFGKKARLLSLQTRREFDKPLCPDPVVSIEPSGNRPCRCLTVASGESFLVQDIVVHNSGGVDSLRSTLKLLAGFPAFGHRPSADKRVRAEPFAAQSEVGNVVIVQDPGPAGAWVQPYIDELVGFPDGLADQVDASSGAFNKLTEGNTAAPVTGLAPAPVPAPTGDQPAEGASAGSAADIMLEQLRRRSGLSNNPVPGPAGPGAPGSGLLGIPPGSGRVGAPGMPGGRPSGLLGFPTGGGGLLK